MTVRSSALFWKSKSGILNFIIQDKSANFLCILLFILGCRILNKSHHIFKRMKVPSTTFEQGGGSIGLIGSPSLPFKDCMPLFFRSDDKGVRYIIIKFSNIAGFRETE